MGIGEEGQANNDGKDDTKKAEEEAVRVHCSACIEEHFIEHLSPTLRKGNEWDKDLNPSFPLAPFVTINRSVVVFNGSKELFKQPEWVFISKSVDASTRLSNKTVICVLYTSNRTAEVCFCSILT